MSSSLPIRATGIALAALLCATFAHAQGFIPPPAPWRERPATPTTIAPPTTLPPGVPPHAPAPPPPPTPPGAPTPQPEAAPLRRGLEEAKPPRLPPFGASFTYAQRNEDVDIVGPGFSKTGTTDVSVYAGRLDGSYGCSLGETIHCPPDPGDASAGRIGLNLAMLAGYADGSTEIDGQRSGMNGPVLGTAALITLSGSPKSFTLWSKERFFVPFLMGGFDYAATDFSTLDGWVHTFDVKPRAGLTFQVCEGDALSLYGGGSWERFTEEQTSSRTGITAHVRPQEPWAGLVGANYQVAKGEPLERFSFTAEGELGDRTGVVLLVRYEFDVPH